MLLTVLNIYWRTELRRGLFLYLFLINKITRQQRRNHMSNTNEAIYSILQTIVDNFNTQQLDTPDNKTNKASGAENLYYNRDVRYFLGGIVSQIAWSICNKQEYIDTVEHKIHVEKENNAKNADTENLEKSLATAEASIENALFFYDLFVQIHNVLAGVPWNNNKMTNKKGYKDYGQEWFANYKDSLSGKPDTPKISKKQREDTVKAEMKANLKLVSSK